MPVRLVTSLTTAQAIAVANAIDAGPGAGIIQFRTGSQNTDPDSAAAGTEVATLTFSDPCTASVVDGLLTFGPISSDTNATGGVIGHARIATSADATVFECDVSATGGGGTIELSSLTIGAGDTVSMSAFTYDVPDGV